MLRVWGVRYCNKTDDRIVRFRVSHRLPDQHDHTNGENEPGGGCAARRSQYRRANATRGRSGRLGTRSGAGSDSKPGLGSVAIVTLFGGVGDGLK